MAPFNKISRRSPKQNAFILLPVVLTLAILATVAYLLSRESAINAGNVNREQQQDAALYVAQAGYNHAIWYLNRQNCTGYSDIPTHNLGNQSYLAAFTDTNGTALTAGSPANIKVVGTLVNGTSYTILRNREKVYQYPLTTVTLQLGTDPGKDVSIKSFYNLRNFGADDEQVSSASGSLRQQLIYFDLSSIPAEANIVLAQLELTQTANVSADVDARVAVHRITQNWVEGTKTGSGQPDGATWDTADGSQVWNDGSGGSYDTTSVDSTVITTANVVRTWDISALVQGWHLGQYANEGLLLKGSGTVFVTFASKEDSSINKRPKLIITYSCECGVFCTGTSAGNLLLVVVDPVSLTTQEADKKTLFESWGYVVTTIDVNDAQTAFDTAIAGNDVVFITEDIDSTRLNTKLVNATIGVVTEEDNLSDEFGMASTITWDSGDTLNITDNSHYITQPFSLGNLTVMTAVNSLAYVSGTQSVDLKNLGSFITRPALVTLDKGATTYTAGTVAGRRVQLPWGGNTFDVNTLTSEGLTLMQRAIEWGAGSDTIVEVTVAASNDDAEERISTGAVNLTSTDMELVFDGTKDQFVGLRFAGLNIPPSSSISKAYIQFQVDETNTGATTVTINIEDADDATTFTTSTNEISNRTLAVPSVVWSPPSWNTVGDRGVDQQTPDISALIQAVLDRPGWSSGNAMVIVITGTGERTAEAYDGDAAGAAMLHIEFN